jgi:c-di-GMP-binding flagellar brake protein YcgR
MTEGVRGMEDRRKDKRYRLIYYLQVFNRKNELFMGNLIDITTEGMMLTSERPIEVGKIYQIGMNIQFLGQQDLSLELEAESRWSRPADNANYYDTGFKFVNVSEDQKMIIEQLTKELGFNG